MSYPKPNADLPESLEELRANREYSRAIVDEFVNMVFDPCYLAPGAAMFLFVAMCTKFSTSFSEFGGVIRKKLLVMYRFWNESHPWVRANILFEMRERLYHEHHRNFCLAFSAKARQYDKIVDEEKVGEVKQSCTKQEVTNEQESRHEEHE
jgi:hypothetical protein